MANTSSAQGVVGKVALVTGAASGIGKATAQRLAKAGVMVALADMNEAALTDVADTIRADKGQAIAVRLDVASETGWEATRTSPCFSCWRHLSSPGLADFAPDTLSVKMCFFSHPAFWSASS
jgi:hypothetical protein